MNKTKKIFLIFLVILVMAVPLFSFNVSAWTDDEVKPYNRATYTHFRFGFETLTITPNEFYLYINTYGTQYSGINLKDNYVMNGPYGFSTDFYIPLDGYYDGTTSVMARRSYKYAVTQQDVLDISHNFFSSALGWQFSGTDYPWNDPVSIAMDELNYVDTLDFAEYNYFTQYGYLYVPFIIKGNVEIGSYVTSTDFVSFSPYDADRLSVNLTTNVLFGANQLDFDVLYSDTVNTYLIIAVLPINTIRDMTRWGVYDYYKDTTFDEQGGASILFKDALVNATDVGVSIADSSNLGENVLGSSLNAPVDSLNDFTLFTYDGVDITLGGVVGCVIALTLFILFLKMFAGG